MVLITSSMSVPRTSRVNLTTTSPPDKVLLKHEREKKSKCLNACLKQICHFTLFVVSTNGQIGQEDKVLLKCVSALTNRVSHALWFAAT
jgi:hypothetical protein